MTVSEKVAYLKGLAEGMKLNEENDADKLTLKILDVLSDIALDMEDIDDALAELAAQVDEIDEDLSTVEEIVYDDEDGCGCGCGDCDCDCDCGCGCGDDEEEFYEVTCPACNADFEVDEETLLEGAIACPNCGQNLEFDIEDCDCCDGDCDCGCEE